MLSYYPGHTDAPVLDRRSRPSGPANRTDGRFDGPAEHGPSLAGRAEASLRAPFTRKLPARTDAYARRSWNDLDPSEPGIRGPDAG